MIFGVLIFFILAHYMIGIKEYSESLSPILKYLPATLLICGLIIGYIIKDSLIKRARVQNDIHTALSQVKIAYLIVYVLVEVPILIAIVLSILYGDILFTITALGGLLVFYFLKPAQQDFTALIN